MDAADQSFPPESDAERAHRDDFTRDYGWARWFHLSTDDVERLMREIDHA